MRCVTKAGGPLVKYVSDAKSRDSIIADIRLMHLSQSPIVFEKMAKLFIQKWKQFSQFCGYFKRTWIDLHGTWYAGVARGVPCTNNGTESFNDLIKKQTTIREKLPVGTFLVELIKSTEMWSKDARFDGEVPIPDPLWKEAWVWAKANVGLEPHPSSTDTFFALDCVEATNPLIWTQPTKIEEI